MERQHVLLSKIIHSSYLLTEQEKKEFIGVLSQLPERLQAGLTSFFGRDRGMIRVLYKNYQSKLKFRSDPSKWSNIVEEELKILLKQEPEMIR